MQMQVDQVWGQCHSLQIWKFENLVSRIEVSLWIKADQGCAALTGLTEVERTPKQPLILSIINLKNSG